MQGPLVVLVAATESGTDEDSEHAGRVARVMIDYYIRRPSLEDVAMNGITKECNNGLFALHERDSLVCCDTAALFVLEDAARFFISGDSFACHFKDRKLVRETSNEPYPLLGEKSKYKPRLEPMFPLEEADNVFLIASNKLRESVTSEQMMETLRDSSNAAEWMDRLVGRAGRETQFCATALFMEPVKSGGLRGMLRRKPPKPPREKGLG